jgi:hypothetical protein
MKQLIVRWLPGTRTLARNAWVQLVGFVTLVGLIFDAQSIWEFLTRNALWLVSLAQSQYFPWAIALVLIAMLAFGIRQTVAAQTDASAATRAYESELEKRLEIAARRHFEPHLEKAVENTEIAVKAIRAMAEYFAKARSLEVIESRLHAISNLDNEFERIFAANAPLDGPRNPADKVYSELDHNLVQLSFELSPYLEEYTQISHVTKAESESPEFSPPPGLQHHLKAVFTRWSIIRARIASLRQNGVERLRRETKGIDRFLANI